MLSSPKVEVNLRNNKKRTALMIACEKNLPDVVRALLNKPGIEVDLQDECGDSALLWAVAESSADAAVVMISRPEGRSQSE